MPTANNPMRTTQIVQIRTESPSVKTFVFTDKLCSKAKPGQFLMLWIPGIDEIPLSIMDASNGLVSVSVKAVGDATRHLHSIGSRRNNRRTWPIRQQLHRKPRQSPLSRRRNRNRTTTLFSKTISSQNRATLHLLKAQKLQTNCCLSSEIGGVCQEKNIITTTDDGTAGLQCLVTQPLASLLDKEHFDMIYTCGPEVMVKKIFEITEARKLPIEASLERLMRCGIGLCGSCVIGKYRVCRDGPVFNAVQLREIKDELGISKIGFDGSRIPF